MIVASDCRAEIAAAERVFRQCVVEGIAVASGVSEQPYTQEETIRGAANRLDAARSAKPGADFYVAIQSGLSEVTVPTRAEDAAGAGHVELRFMDIGWVLLERAGSGARAVAPSAGVEIPQADVAFARARGLEGKTAGAVVSERVGLLDTQDPHGWLTAGRRPREALLGEALAIALGQLERSDRLSLLSTVAGPPQPPSAAPAVPATLSTPAAASACDVSPPVSSSCYTSAAPSSPILGDGVGVAACARGDDTAAGSSLSGRVQRRMANTPGARS